MEVRQMNVAEAEASFQTLTEYYYLNSRACSCMEHFSYQEATYKIRSMIEHMSDGSAIVYGCFDHHALIGYLWAYEIQFREEKRVYISEVHVDQRFRGHGLGTALLDAVEIEAKERGVPALFLHAEADNKKALRLYEHIGFRLERVQLRKSLK